MSRKRKKQQITLIGAGLAGSLLSIYLARRGFDVEVFERRPDMRTEAISAGRSINMALSTRGIYALQQVGVLDTVMQQAIPMRGRMIHALNGSLSFIPYGKDETEVIYSISRAGLNIALLNAAEQHGVRIHFRQKCTGLHLRQGEIELLDTKTRQSRRLRVDRVIGTDGSASAIRTAMLPAPRFNFSQAYLEHGYKELTIPPNAGGGFRMEKNALHIWPRGTYMLIALPNPDGSFTCTLFYPFHGPHSFETLKKPDDVRRFFEQEFPDAVPLLSSLTEEFFENPTGSLVTIRCFPWHFGSRAGLLGDAAHAIVPFFGQGMNCAFEDCTYFNGSLDQHPGDWERMFRTFETLRKPNTDAIADLALANFIEMRDHVADPKFALKKEIELALEARFPTRFIPKYSMVTFHRTISYATAQARGRIQDRILEKLSAGIDSVEALDWALAEQLVLSELQELPPVADSLMQV